MPPVGVCRASDALYNSKFVLSARVAGHRRRDPQRQRRTECPAAPSAASGLVRRVDGQAPWGTRTWRGEGAQGAQSAQSAQSTGPPLPSRARRCEQAGFGYIAQHEHTTERSAPTGGRVQDKAIYFAERDGWEIMRGGRPPIERDYKRQGEGGSDRHRRNEEQHSGGSYRTLAGQVQAGGGGSGGLRRERGGDTIVTRNHVRPARGGRTTITGQSLPGQVSSDRRGRRQSPRWRIQSQHGQGHRSQRSRRGRRG